MEEQKKSLARRAFALAAGEAAHLPTLHAEKIRTMRSPQNGVVCEYKTRRVHITGHVAFNSEDLFAPVVLLRTQVALIEPRGGKSIRPIREQIAVISQI